MDVVGAWHSLCVAKSHADWQRSTLSSTKRLLTFSNSPLRHQYILQTEHNTSVILPNKQGMASGTVQGILMPFKTASREDLSLVLCSPESSGKIWAR